MNIGFIGFGEVGYEMSQGFMEENNHHIHVYDSLYENEDIIQRAKETQVTLYDDPVKVVKNDLDVLFVAVPASYAMDAWNSVWDHVNKQTYYVDLTTASAKIKKQICSQMLDYGAKSFVDGAIMGPLKGNQHKVLINVSGVEAKQFQHFSSEMNMNVSFISNEVGDATNIKFIRSIYTKGLSTLLHEVMEMAELFNLEDTILESLTKTMDKDPFEIILNRMITGNVLHAERRVKEMENVIELMQTNHKEPHMTSATRNKLEAIANKNLKDHFNGEAPENWKTVIRTINHS